MKIKAFLSNIKEKTGRIPSKLYTLYLAYKDPRTPWYARYFCLFLLAYALSPIDLIPDFIPILGYLDDLVLLPLGVALAFRMIPPVVIEDCSRAAEIGFDGDKKLKAVGAAVVIGFWAVVLAIAIKMILGLLRSSRPTL